MPPQQAISNNRPCITIARYCFWRASRDRNVKCKIALFSKSKCPLGFHILIAFA
jgi:hypothetical protein